MTVYVLYCIALLYWTIIYSGSGDGDTLEHVHSSWMVYHGKIPYKDFFQHHNPLMWYLAAPFVGMFEYTLRAVDAANALTATATALAMLYMYRMHKDFLTNEIGGLIAAAFFALPQESLYNKDFKPDNFMTSALVIGIYYFLCYVKEKKLSKLVISFLALFAAFMFTQKAALIILGIGCIGLYLLEQKQLKITDCLYAAILPVAIYLTFLAFLYSEGVLQLYFKANFELNSHIPDVFYTRRFISPCWEMIYPLILAFYSLLFCSYKENIYVKIISAIFVIEYVIRMYYFTPFIYYFAFLHAMASIMAGIGAMDIIRRHSYLVWCFVAYFLICGGIYFNTYRYRITIGDSFKYGASGLVLEKTTPCDYVLNGYRIGYNLFNKDVDFIWNLKGQIDVIAATIGIRPLSDLESLVRKYKPKIIYGGNYYDTYREYRGDIGKYPIHWISRHLLNEMYEPLYRDNLYILKPEFQKHNCQYNPRTKTYEYRD